jgi:hypothetical protein
MYSFLFNSTHSDKPLEVKVAKVKSQGNTITTRSIASSATAKSAAATSSAASKSTLSEKQTPNLSKGIKKRGK